jgi:hypothetical protein
MIKNLKDIVLNSVLVAGMAGAVYGGYTHKNNLMYICIGISAANIIYRAYLDERRNK